MEIFSITYAIGSLLILAAGVFMYLAQRQKMYREFWAANHSLKHAPGSGDPELWVDFIYHLEKVRRSARLKLSDEAAADYLDFIKDECGKSLEHFRSDYGINSAAEIAKFISDEKRKRRLKKALPAWEILISQ